MNLINNSALSNPDSQQNVQQYNNSKKNSTNKTNIKENYSNEYEHPVYNFPFTKKNFH